MKYLPESAVSDWYPPDNPYLRRWKLDNIPEFRWQYTIIQRLTKGLADAGVSLLARTDDMVPCQLPGFSMWDELDQLDETCRRSLPVLVHVVSQRARVLRLRRTEQPLAISVAAVLPSSLPERSRHPVPSAFVGSRTGAMLRRFSLACFSPFPLGVPQYPNRKLVSSPRHLERRERISRATLSCGLHVKAYTPSGTGTAFASADRLSL